MPRGDREDSPRRLTWRLDAIDVWRSEIEGRVSVLQSKVGDIVFTDKLAQELSDRLKQRTTHQFTLWQKLLGGAVSAVIVAGEIKTLLGH